MDKEPIELIQAFGLTDAQARCYWGLLRCQPATAFQIASESGIATTAIYPVIHELLALRIVHAVDAPSGKTRSEQQKRYAALEPTLFLERIKHDLQQKAERLAPLLYDRVSVTSEQPIWSFDNRKTMLETAGRIMHESKQHLRMAIHEKEWAEMHGAILNTQARRLRCEILYSGEHEHTGPSMQRCVIPVTGAQRTFYLTGDNRQAMMACIESNGVVQGSFSEQPAYIISIDRIIQQQALLSQAWHLLPPVLRRQYVAEPER